MTIQEIVEKLAKDRAERLETFLKEKMIDPNEYEIVLKHMDMDFEEGTSRIYDYTVYSFVRKK